MRNIPSKQQHVIVTEREQLLCAVRELADFYSKTSLGKSDIAMFSLGRYGLVLGGDVDKLYLECGWDFASCKSEDGYTTIHYLLVSPQGRQTLIHSGLRIVPMSSSYEVVSCFDDFVISFAQQQLDFFRNMVGVNTIDIALFEQPIMFREDGYMRKAGMTALVISATTVSVTLDYRDSFVIANGKDWRLDYKGMSLLFAVDNILESKRGIIYSQFLGDANEKKEWLISNKAVYDLYLRDKREKGKDGVILVKEKGMLISFDDDAILLFSKFKTKLFHCRMMSHRDHATAVISNRQFQGLVEDRQLEYNIVTPSISRDFYDFRFTSSILNLKGRADLSFKAISIIKSTDGCYYVHATTADGNSLKPKPVSSGLGIYCLSLPSGKEKTLLQEAIAHKLYDSSIE